MNESENDPDDIKNEPGLMETKDVARYMKISPRQVFNLTERGLLSVTKIGRSVRFKPAEVKDAVDRLTIRAKR